jgi:hypothetical protein
VVSTQSIPMKDPACVSRTIDGQSVIIDCGRWNNHLLNDVGSRVWNLIDGKRSVEAIAAEVRRQMVPEEYESIPAGLEKDIEDFLAQIASMGIITMEPPRQQE